MDLLRADLREILLDGKAPPTEVLIFPFGTIRTRKGTFQFTRRSAALVMAQWTAYGRDFGFDYNHAEFNPQVAPQEKIAAGWGKLVVKPAGLFCTGIRWSPDAARKIVAKELRYLSAALSADKATGEIVGVENCALTNSPATLDPIPLMLSASDPANISSAGVDRSWGKSARIMQAGRTGRPHLQAKEPTMPPEGAAGADTTKQQELGRSGLKSLAGCLSFAQKLSESADETMKALGGKMATGLAEYLAAAKGAFPGLEPDGDEPDEGEKAKKELAALSATIEKVTGQKTGQVGALLALGKRLEIQAEQLSAGGKEAAEKAALVDKMVKETRQIEESERAYYLSLTLPDLKVFAELAQTDRKLRASDRTITTGTEALPAGAGGPGAKDKAKEAAQAEAHTAFLAMGYSEAEAAEFAKAHVSVAG